MTTADLRVITTGGTIASTRESGGDWAPELAGERVLDGVSPERIGRVKVEPFSNILSPNLGPDLMERLARRVKDLAADPAVRGIVVTHGTGLMEETSFAVDLLYSGDTPIIFTGAMRGRSEPDTDGPRNLADALTVADSEEARGQGVLAVMNRGIHSARDVTKQHTEAIDAFTSGEYGALGRIAEGGRVLMPRRRADRITLASGRLELRVDLIKFASGLDGRFIQTSVETGARGLVIEASGAGGVNEATYEAVGQALEAGLTVVIVSRCGNGPLVPTYGTKGGSAATIGLGAIDGGDLSGPKARILLMAALGTGGPAMVPELFAAARDRKPFAP